MKLLYFINFVGYLGTRFFLQYFIHRFQDLEIHYKNVHRKQLIRITLIRVTDQCMHVGIDNA